MEKEDRKRERKWQIIMSQNPKQDEVIKQAKRSRKTCHHCPEHREMFTNSLEMGKTVFLKKEKT